MMSKRFLRYLAPNLVTFASLAFGMASIVASLQGRYADAAWFVVFSVLTDKLDGFVARLVKGTSEFGVQLDSFADFLNFGIAPATLFYAFLSRPESPIATGIGHAFTIASVGLWVGAVTFRLARYNIVGDDPRCRHLFFGVPTTLMGGTLATLFLTLLKYGADPGGTLLLTDEPRLLAPLVVPPGVWVFWPFLVIAGAFLMASSLRVPKLGRVRSRALTAFIMANVALGYVAGATRHLPEILCFHASVWLVASLVYHRVNASARLLRPPPIFPPEKRPGVAALAEELHDEDEVEDAEHEPVAAGLRPGR